MSEGGFSFTFLDETMQLLPQKAIWFNNHKALLVSDTHLAKGAHFRKAGIAIPKGMAQVELSNLSDLIDQLNPKTIFFLGDLFHSDGNSDCDWFQLWREMHHHIQMVLIKGNHDILPKNFYECVKMEVVDYYDLGPFRLLHQPPKKNSGSNKYLITGHIHPGIKLVGKARQGISLPCFFFGREFAILPAFGKFTGKALLKLKEGDIAFAIAGKKIVAIEA